MPTALRSLTILTVIAATASSLPAADVVVRRTGDQREGGTVSNVTKTEVTVTKQVGGDVVIPANDIAFIEWDSAPASMALGRAALQSGQLESAQKQLETAKTEAAGSDNANLKADIDFYLASVLAERAFADAGQVAAARQQLEAFLRANANHYRAFDAQLLLADVALAGDDFAAASAAYTTAAAAPWKDYQMAAQVGTGRVLLAQDNVDGAKREFDAVAAVKPENDAQKARRLDAMLGQATCLQKQEQYEQAVAALDKVIAESTTNDARLQAEAYLRQGDCYLAMGASPKAAIMAYLHVDVIPAMAREADLHAEALYHLSRLWQQIGQTDRAREATETLRSGYPNSEWAAKLGN